MNMNTAFQIGQTIKARITAQGLHAGECYRVASVHQRPTPFGTFVAYVVASLRADQPGFEWEIVNGHMILEAQ